MPAFVVERYDRTSSAPLGRLHQEDFNQALGATRDEKYQRIGGKVSLARIAKLLTEFGAEGDAVRLLKMLTLSVAIGNLDMHTKNVSLIHHPDGSVNLAPAYDLVPQAHQRNAGEMAMAVAGEYQHAALTRSHLVAECEAWEVNDAKALIDGVLQSVLEACEVETPDTRSYPHLRLDIHEFASNLLAGRGVGVPTE